MATHPTTEGVYGPGTHTDREFTPLPQECARLLRYLAIRQPGFTHDPAFLDRVTFHGDALPIIPGPLKSQALSAVSHAMIGLAASEVAALRGVDVGHEIRISCTHAGLYPGTPALVEIGDADAGELARKRVARSTGADLDRGILEETAMHYRSWAIYATSGKGAGDGRRKAGGEEKGDGKEVRYYQVLGSLHPAEFLRSWGLDPRAAGTRDEAYAIIGREAGRWSADELEARDVRNGFCGQACLTPEEWRATAMGKSLARHSLINYWSVKGDEGLPRVPFPEYAVGDGDRRPLKGVRVLELARVIAAPALCAALASLGAEVIKVQSPELPDIQSLSLTLTVGKRTTPLDIGTEEGRARLERLMSEADVVVQAFRLGSLERKGFGPSAAFEMARKRGKGIVYVDLNCYGPDGYYAERPGFQQIADAASGCSYVIGKAQGTSPVLPSLPIADMLCGSFGVVDVLLALRDRATKGGSYHAHAALTSVDTVQLEQEVGLYPPKVVQEVQDRYKFRSMTPDLMVGELLSLIREGWRSSSTLLKEEEYFTTFEKSAFGDQHRILAPVIQFTNKETRLRWDGPPMPYCFEQDVQWR